MLALSSVVARSLVVSPLCTSRATPKVDEKAEQLKNVFVVGALVTLEQIEEQRFLLTEAWARGLPSAEIGVQWDKCSVGARAPEVAWAEPR